ncbi:uncharacterized protein LOC106057438 isoform X2 [Biomphalaria glabrata]|uniref:Uncharacterized protein LOC106057438 isoform X2 n=1 Tax=Biomphalaria glabrata TaxID=6526 RepID=A0A9W2YQV4_BIOGL|nr:uncharacterized protein LOC106057438 isoform X2 [Biomphalaria glabrata]
MENTTLEGTAGFNLTNSTTPATTWSVTLTAYLWILLREVLIILTGFLTIFGVIINLLVIILYSMNSIRNSIHNWNVLQLAVCDLLSCVFVLLPFHLELYDISLLTHFRLCRVMRYLHYSFGLESSFLVIIIRLLMVLFGKKYRKICTKSVSKFMTFLSWCTVAAMVTPLVVVDVRHGRVMEQNNYSCLHFTGDRQDALKYAYVVITIVFTLLMLCITLSIYWALTRARPQFMVRKSIISKSGHLIGTAHGLKPMVPRSKSIGFTLAHRQNSSLTTLVERSKEVHKKLLCKSRRLMTLWAVFFFVTWTPYATALSVDLWVPDMVPHLWLKGLMWLFLCRHVLHPFLYARYITAFQRRFQEFQTRLENTWFAPCFCRKCCCLFSFLKENYRVSSMKTFNALNQRLRENCCDENSTTSSFRVDTQRAIHYLWRDPRVTIQKSNQKSLLRWKNVLRFNHTIHRDSTLIQWMIPALMTSRRFSRSDSSKSRSSSTPVSLSEILSRQYTCKTSSLSCDSFRIVDEKEYLSQLAYYDHMKETEV